MLRPLALGWVGSGVVTCRKAAWRAFVNFYYYIGSLPLGRQTVLCMLFFGIVALISVWRGHRLTKAPAVFY